ncbi:DUF5320 domain-containing protein [Thermoplasmatota archaeon]
MPNKDETDPEGFGPCGQGLRKGYRMRRSFRKFPEPIITKEEQKKRLEAELLEIEKEKQDIEKKLKEIE